MKANAYDVIVIGGGSGGLFAAKLAHGLGKKVVLVEKNKLGGECTWTGCVPSKALIKIAEVAHHARNLSSFGLKGSVTLDTSQVMNQVRHKIEQVYQTHTPDVLKQLGIDVVFGDPQFVDAQHLQVDDTLLTAKHIFITTGSSPFVPPIEGINDVSYLTNETLFDLETLPNSMTILGGGAIGLEMASALNRLGVKITIVEMAERVVPKEDEEVALILQEQLRKEGVQILVSHKATHVRQENNGITMTCSLRQAQGDRGTDSVEIKAEQLLVAVGRKPNIDGMQLERAGVEVTKKGIVVDSTLRTTAKNIYACGDVIGPYQFSHMAAHQAKTAVRNALIPFSTKINYDHVTWVTFTAPELAAAGMTEQQARERHGDTIKIYRRNYDQIDRGVVDNATVGLGKFICDKKGYLLGAHIVGARAGELIHEVQLGKAYGVAFADFYSVIHAYPAYSELIWHAAKEAYIDKLQRNVILRALRWLFMRKK